jgi:Tol biopolymer transport system component
LVASAVHSETVTCTPTATSTVTPTATQTPAKAPTLASESNQPLIWAEEAGEPVILQGYEGVWSPTALEMIGLMKTDPQTGTLALASGPAFDLQMIDINGANLSGANVFWSPDGQSVAFRGPLPGMEANGVNEYGRLWLMYRNGEHPHPVIKDDTYRFLRFVGWIDEDTLVISDYQGGGNSQIYILDTNNGIEILTTPIGISLPFDVHQNYISAVLDNMLLELFVVTQDRQPDLDLFTGSYYVKFFPRSRIYEEDPSNLYYNGWIPGTNQILAAWYTTDESNNTNAARLIAWNIETDEVNTIAPGGIVGGFSPDGKYLAYITLGSGTFDDYLLSGIPSLDNLEPQSTPYLHLLDLQTEQLVLSFPSFVYLNANYWNVAIAEGRFSFSPDGHYLAFLAPGVPVLDDNGWPISLDTSSLQSYLIIVDLKNHRLLKALPSEDSNRFSEDSWSVWSPDGNHIVYSDSTNNWHVYDCKTDIDIPISESGGNLVTDPQWSFDGSYLSFRTIKLASSFADQIYTTTIFKIP